MHFFYHPDPGTSNHLSADESRHCLRVLRLKRSDQISILDGKGNQYLAQISDDHGPACEFEIIEKQRAEQPSPFRVHVAIAPTKNLDRIEWFVEKSVEIGIDKISFVLCERSERRILKTDRLQKKAVSAMKQSNNLFLPVISEMLSFDEFVSSSAGDEELYIAHAGIPPNPQLKDVATRNQKYMVVVGPEGDFTPKELELAYAKGFHPIGLGSQRFRTETAGLVALHALVLVNS